MASARGWDEGIQNIAPWLDYFWGALLRAYKKFEARVGSIERGRGAKGFRVRAEIRKRNLLFPISEIEEAWPGISRDMVRLVSRTMKAEGLIPQTGKGQGARGKMGHPYHQPSDRRNASQNWNSRITKAKAHGLGSQMRGTGLLFRGYRSPSVSNASWVAA